MKRLHVHVSVNDLQQSIRFYSALFAAQPSVLKDDYAKWMLDDPRVNFAISTRGRKAGLDHLGIQAENGDELEEIGSRLAQADVSTTARRALRAATRRATSTGPSIRRASPGNRSIRSTACRCTARKSGRSRKTRRPPAAPPRWQSRNDCPEAGTQPVRALAFALGVPLHCRRHRAGTVGPGAVRGARPHRRSRGSTFRSGCSSG